LCTSIARNRPSSRGQGTCKATVRCCLISSMLLPASHINPTRQHSCSSKHTASQGARVSTCRILNCCLASSMVSLVSHIHRRSGFAWCVSVHVCVCVCMCVCLCACRSERPERSTGCWMGGAWPSMIAAHTAAAARALEAHVCSWHMRRHLPLARKRSAGEPASPSASLPPKAWTPLHGPLPCWYTGNSRAADPTPQTSSPGAARPPRCMP